MRKIVFAAAALAPAAGFAAWPRTPNSPKLFPFASQVDSGIAELVRKQKAGWQYIH